MGFRDLFFYCQEYIFIVNETVFEVKILYKQSLHVYRPKQLSDPGCLDRGFKFTKGNSIC